MISSTKTMTSPQMLLILVVMMLFGHSCCGQTDLVKVLTSHSAILEKFQPSVAEFSKSLTSALKGGNDMETKLNDVITKVLAVQMDKLSVTTTNRTLADPTDDICCQCNHCVRFCQACVLLRCCCEGDQGCTCISCSTALNMEVSEVGMTMTSTLKLWAESTKRVLWRDVSKVVSQTSQSSDMCCSCKKCLTKRDGCGVGSCCSEGSECMCTKCSSKTIVLIATSIKDPVSLTSEAATAVGQVESLVDSLLVLLTYP